jgi:hypothetical protein
MRQVLIKLEFSRKIFEKKILENIKFHEKLFSGRTVVPCGQTDVTVLLAAFCNVADAPKMCYKDIL